MPMSRSTRSSSRSTTARAIPTGSPRPHGSAATDGAPASRRLGAMKTRADAWALLTEFTQSQPLRRHALAVEATMRHLARSSGVADAAEIETWGLVGMLHDFD